MYISKDNIDKISTIMNINNRPPFHITCKLLILTWFGIILFMLTQMITFCFCMNIHGSYLISPRLNWGLVFLIVCGKTF